MLPARQDLTLLFYFFELFFSSSSSFLHCSVIYPSSYTSLSLCISADPPASLALLSPTLFYQLRTMQFLVKSIMPLRPVKTLSWSRLASLHVIMKRAHVLICTKTISLMNIQYWMPFIRVKMKNQYHLPFAEHFRRIVSLCRLI